VSYLLDTCAISEFEKDNRNEGVVRFLLSLPIDRTFLSAITVGEIQRGITRQPEGQRRLRLEAFLERQLETYSRNILSIDLHVGRLWGELYASCQKRGFNLSASDSLIAATALQHGLHVVTRNVGDFEPTGVLIINPWA
jgi:toxin FitB